MFENYESQQTSQMGEHLGANPQAPLVQIGHVSMPKLNIPSQLPPGLTHWSPTSSDSGDTEKEDSSRSSLASHRFAANMMMQSSGVEDKNFFNLPSNNADMQPLEASSSNSHTNVFEFSRPSGSHFPSSMDAQFNGNSFQQEHDMNARNDPKMQERLQYQMLMQRKLMYEQEGKAVSPSFRNSIPVQPPSGHMQQMQHNPNPSAYTTSYPENVMYGANKYPAGRFPGMGGSGSNGSSPSHAMHSMYQQQQQQQPPMHAHMHAPMNPMNRSPMAADYSNLRVTGAPGSMMPPQAYPSYGMPPQVAPSANGRIYQVQFKCSLRNFTLGAHASQSISVGDFVVVEADRGEDVGIVTDIMPMKTFIERRIYLKAVVDEEDNVIGRIVRLASPAERQLLPDKFRDEENVLQLCRELSYGTYRLPMMIHDVDYQFDRHKLTIFYSSESRIDFREFVRDLFSAYKARIWMKKVNSARPVRVEQWASMSLATGMQFSPERTDNNNMPMH